MTTHDSIIGSTGGGYHANPFMAGAAAAVSPFSIFTTLDIPTGWFELENISADGSVICGTSGLVAYTTDNWATHKTTTIPDPQNISTIAVSNDGNVIATIVSRDYLSSHNSIYQQVRFIRQLRTYVASTPSPGVKTWSLADSKNLVDTTQRILAPKPKSIYKQATFSDPSGPNITLSYTAYNEGGLEELFGSIIGGSQSATSVNHGIIINATTGVIYGQPLSANYVSPYMLPVGEGPEIAVGPFTDEYDNTTSTFNYGTLTANGNTGPMTLPKGYAPKPIYYSTDGMTQIVDLDYLRYVSGLSSYELPKIVYTSNTANPVESSANNTGSVFIVDGDGNAYTLITCSRKNNIALVMQSGSRSNVEFTCPFENSKFNFTRPAGGGTYFIRTDLYTRSTNQKTLLSAKYAIVKL